LPLLGTLKCPYSMMRRDRTYPYLALKAVGTSRNLSGDAEWTEAFMLNIARSDAMPVLHPDVGTTSRDAVFILRVFPVPNTQVD
jgi:hypothetical protein